MYVCVLSVDIYKAKYKEDRQHGCTSYSVPPHFQAVSVDRNRTVSATSV